MGGAKGVVNVDLGEGGELFGEGWVVGFFFRMEAEIFQEQNLAGLELAGKFRGNVTNAVGGKADIDVEADVVVEQFAKAVDDGAQGILGVGLAFGAAEVRREDDLGVVADGVLDGREGWRGCGCRR